MCRYSDKRNNDTWIQVYRQRYTLVKRSKKGKPGITSHDNACTTCANSSELWTHIWYRHPLYIPGSPPSHRMRMQNRTNCINHNAMQVVHGLFVPNAHHVMRIVMQIAQCTCYAIERRIIQCASGPKQTMRFLCASRWHRSKYFIRMLRALDCYTLMHINQRGSDAVYISITSINAIRIESLRLEFSLQWELINYSDAHCHTATIMQYVCALLFIKVMRIAMHCPDVMYMHIAVHWGDAYWKSKPPIRMAITLTSCSSMRIAIIYRWCDMYALCFTSTWCILLLTVPMRCICALLDIDAMRINNLTLQFAWQSHQLFALSCALQYYRTMRYVCASHYFNVMHIAVKGSDAIWMRIATLQCDVHYSAR